MSIRRCHHIKPNGLVCGSPALRGRSYCYYHHDAAVREYRRSLHSGLNISCIEFGNLETPEEVQASIIDTLTALIQKRIDQQVAGKVLYGLQLAMQNLNNLGSADPRLIEAVDDLGPQPGEGPHDFDLLNDRLAEADRQLTDSMLHPAQTLHAQVLADYPDYDRHYRPERAVKPPQPPQPSPLKPAASTVAPNVPLITLQQKNANFIARMRTR